jgi:hypothetical protein
MRAWISTISVLFLIAVAITSTPTPVMAQQGSSTGARAIFERVAATSQGKSRTHRRGTARYVAPQPQIACTVLGCNPVPPGCHPEPQRYFSGMTTGFDAVVCR